MEQIPRVVPEYKPSLFDRFYDWSIETPLRASLVWGFILILIILLISVVGTFLIMGIKKLTEGYERDYDTPCANRLKNPATGEPPIAGYPVHEY